MQQPRLVIVAGCNGAGKSTYSKSIVSELNIVPFDYDKRFLEIYNSMLDSELREKIAQNKTTVELETMIEEAFSKSMSFCFETNFHIYPEVWINRAKSLNYEVVVFFFCLESLELAKERVKIRVQNDGHNVDDHVVDYKWREGYKNINEYYSVFNYLIFFDNSRQESPKPLFQMLKVNEEEYSIFKFTEIPGYAKRRLPAIFSLLDEQN